MCVCIFQTYAAAADIPDRGGLRPRPIDKPRDPEPDQVHLKQADHHRAATVGSAGLESSCTSASLDMSTSSPPSSAMRICEASNAISRSPTEPDTTSGMP